MDGRQQCENGPAMIRRAAGGISFSVYDRLPLVSCLLRLIWYDSGSDHRLNLALRALPEHRSVAGRVEAPLNPKP